MCKWDACKFYFVSFYTNLLLIQEKLFISKFSQPKSLVVNVSQGSSECTKRQICNHSSTIGSN